MIILYQIQKSWHDCGPGREPLDTAAKKELVARGYDEIADTYLRRFGRSAVRAQKLDEFVCGLPPRARVLDLGCGAGLPVAFELSQRGIQVTGVDASAQQIERARRNVPSARFIHGDMTAVAFPAGSFDAVAAFYSMTHVPREEHAGLLRRIADWLQPGGRFLASFGTEAGDWMGQWQGTAMFFSHHDIGQAKQLVLDAGFVIERADVLRQDNEVVEFLWITARKS
jgi:SAM-dependent methyltransferase